MEQTAEGRKQAALQMYEGYKKSFPEVGELSCKTCLYPSDAALQQSGSGILKAACADLVHHLVARPLAPCCVINQTIPNTL